AAHSFSGWEIHPLTAWRISTASPSFSLAANPSSLSLLPGQSGSSSITVNSVDSFTGMVSLATTTLSGLNSSGPAPTVAINPSSVVLAAGGTATATLTVGTSSSNTGDYAITITATGNNLTQSLSLSLSIVDFAVSANPTSLTVPISSSRQSTITLSSINGFSGSVGLTAYVRPAGLALSSPSASLSASDLTLSAGGAGTITLTVTASLLTTPGTYDVTLSATTSGVTHSTVVTVNVTIF
ncbi:hypothetical protein J2P12_08405, partial [Candidatus Bathyarchaeota archaeon]|nr:hypothetical protein [Candidatus Bathyarchaeota archaeon]